MDSEPLRKLYETYYHEIYLYLYSLCRNPDTAADLCQETFLKALLSLKESHGNLRAWLYMVARNLYLNHRKKEQRCADWDEKTFDRDLSASDLLTQVISTETKQLLYRGLQQLNPVKREILQLQYFSKLSHNDIAAILKLSAANVRVLALRGRRELKQFMEENGYEL
jgi:RNA polymerase sigma-70 factor (ECF subfamily)